MLFVHHDFEYFHLPHISIMFQTYEGHYYVYMLHEGECLPPYQLDLHLHHFLITILPNREMVFVLQYEAEFDLAVHLEYLGLHYFPIIFLQILYSNK